MKPRRPLHVLLVDDSALARELVGAVLTRAGMHVTIAADGEAALDKVARKRPDVVVLDLLLPRLDGLGFLRRTQAGRALPVVVCSNMGEGSEAPFANMLDALAATILGEPDAENRIELALGILRDLDAKALLSRALTIAATTDLEQGHLARAAARATEALHAAEVVGRRSEIVMALVILSRVALRRGDRTAAERYAQAAADDLRDPHAVAAHARRAALAITDPDRP